jgi:Phosphoesterase family
LAIPAPFGPCPRVPAWLRQKKTLRNAEICALFVTELLQVSFCLLAVVREMVSARPSESCNPPTGRRDRLMQRRDNRSHAATADQNHDYPNEQEAMDHGLMDKFVQFTGTPEADGSPTVVMDYFDGNTVTAYWN